MNYYGQGGGMGGMDPRMMQMNQMQGMQAGGMQAMPPGMGGGMMQPGMGGMGGMGQMGMGGGLGMPYGQAYRQLGYDYNLPQLGYKPDTSWGAWDLANAQYSGGRLERGFFDNIISTLTNFFANRHLSEGASREAHRRVYFAADGEDAGNKTLGGAAAYQAFLIWDRDHHSAYHSFPSQENRERLIGLAVAELFALWDRVQPRSSRANVEEASQYAAATAKYLFDRHYDLQHSHNHGGHGGHGGFGRGFGRNGYSADDDSDTESEGRRMRRRSMYGQGGAGYGMPGMQGMQGMQGMPGGMTGMQNPMMNMQAGMGMHQPGMGAMGQPGFMNGMTGMGMNPMMAAQMGMGGMGMAGGGMHNGMPMGMHHGMGMNPMMGGQMGGMGMGGPMGMMANGLGHMQMGVPPHGSIGEMQAGPGMHPYTYGNQSGVAYGQQPIDSAGNNTFPGGPGRSWYGYGQPRF